MPDTRARADDGFGRSTNTSSHVQTLTYYLDA